MNTIYNVGISSFSLVLRIYVYFYTILNPWDYFIQHFFILQSLHIWSDRVFIMRKAQYIYNFDVSVAQRRGALPEKGFLN